jgi:hypothetical protein
LPFGPDCKSSRVFYYLNNKKFAKPIFLIKKWGGQRQKKKEGSQESKK